METPITARSPAGRRESVFVLLALMVAGLVIFARGLNVHRWGDDLATIFEDPAARACNAFVSPCISGVHYRPINTFFNAIVQYYFGLNTVPIHIVHVLLHATMAWFVYFIVRKFGFSLLQSVLAATFMLCAQVVSHPILSNCTFMQITVSLFGCGTLYFAYKFFLPTVTGRGETNVSAVWNWFLALLCYIGAILSKEMSLSYLGMLAVVTAACFVDARDRKRLFVRAAAVLVPFVLLTLAYLSYRKYLGGLAPNFHSDETYGFRLGTNVLVNVVMSLVAPFQPLSSAMVFATIKSRDFLIIFISGVSAFVVLTATAWGLYREWRPRFTICFIIMAIGTLFPTSLMNHVGELYVYDALPFLAVLIGIGLGETLRSLQGGAFKSMLTASLVGVLILNIVSIQLNINMVKDNGLRADRYLEQIVAVVPQLPLNTQVLLVDGPPSGMEYSVYVMNDFDVLQSWSEQRIIRSRSGRQDIKVKIVKWKNYRDTDDPLTVPLFTDGYNVLDEKPPHVQPKGENSSSPTPNSTGEKPDISGSQFWRNGFCGKTIIIRNKLKPIWETVS